MHGDLNQEQRERAMAAFKAGKKDVLIATDVAARGIDVDDVTHVINHTIPDDDKAYLHRAGRTGRAGKTGIAVTFVDWDDLHKWALINRALEFGQPEPVETYSSSPHLFTDLDIPAGTKGRLKPARRGRADALEHRGSQRGPRRGDAERAPRSRSRRRTRGGQPVGRVGARARGRDGRRGRRGRRKEPGTGTHDGKGHEHHDGNAAPRAAAVAAGPRTGGRRTRPRPERARRHPLGRVAWRASDGMPSTRQRDASRALRQRPAPSRDPRR